MSPAAAVDDVFVALADPSRRQLLEILGRGEGRTASALARELPISRQAIGKHLTTMLDAGLVTSARDGREVLFRVRPERLVATASWLNDVAASWETRLADLKRRAETVSAPRGSDA